MKERFTFLLSTFLLISITFLQGAATPFIRGVEGNQDIEEKPFVHYGYNFNLETKKPIQFKKMDNVFLKGSYEAMDSLVNFLKANKDIDLIRVESHVKDAPTTESAISLSKERAERIVDYFIDKGLDCKRLIIVGYGAMHLGERGIISDTIRIQVLTINAHLMGNESIAWGGKPLGRNCEKKPVPIKKSSTINDVKNTPLKKGNKIKTAK